ncbi:MAG: hypothetical protein JSV61_04770 [Anaerolineales bacterium]|nr:MAG: hypothetical protein JSV61_04770 [Anaerolineales bacterium]
MIDKRKAFFAWILFGLITASNVIAIINLISKIPVRDKPTPLELVFPIVPVFFAFVGALIISRQPRNVIGLVMMLPGLSLAFVVDAYLAPYLSGQLPPPATPSLLFLIILWFSNWNWLLLVLPVMFMMLLFPTGQPLSPRWKWLVYFGLGIVVVFVFLITFAQVVGPNVDPLPWSVPNPIGFLKPEWINTIVGPFMILFPVWILLCAVSLFVRFRRARAVEREQIKWLFYAGAIFIVFYMPSFIGNTYSQAENFWNLLLPIGMLTFPTAIAIAILRYRLYEIDIIIRKTLQYTLLTAMLGLVYFGLVILLDGFLRALVGSSGQVATVISTLAIAALFTPLRRRVQEIIDRRFYRQKYNAEQALAEFAAATRDETDLEALTARVVGIVQDTMRPEAVSLWLKPVPSQRSFLPSQK